MSKYALNELTCQFKIFQLCGGPYGENYGNSSGH